MMTKNQTSLPQGAIALQAIEAAQMSALTAEDEAQDETEQRCECGREVLVAWSGPQPIYARPMTVSAEGTIPIEEFDRQFARCWGRVDSNFVFHSCGGQNMSDWQPIETAPKNIVALCYWPTSAEGYRVAVASNEGGFWKIVHNDDFLGGPMSDPTHWMPLPEPPK
jgi:hypothetical protein